MQSGEGWLHLPGLYGACALVRRAHARLKRPEQLVAACLCSICICRFPSILPFQPLLLEIESRFLHLHRCDCWAGSRTPDWGPSFGTSPPKQGLKTSQYTSAHITLDYPGTCDMHACKHAHITSGSCMQGCSRDQLLHIRWPSFCQSIVIRDELLHAKHYMYLNSDQS